MNQTNYKKTRYNVPFIAQRADPYIMQEDGMYYFTASVPAYDCIVLRRASSLEGLKDAPETEIWHCHDSGIMSKHIWAPELHHIDGRWYVYFAAGEKDDIWNIRPWVLRCEGDDPLAGPWTECGNLKRVDDDEFSFTDFSLDMTTFVNNGVRYCVWAEKVSVGRKISNLYIAKMEDALTLSTPQMLLTAPTYDWERHGFWCPHAESGGHGGAEPFSGGAAFGLLVPAVFTVLVTVDHICLILSVELDVQIRQDHAVQCGIEESVITVACGVVIRTDFLFYFSRYQKRSGETAVIS